MKHAPAAAALLGVASLTLCARAQADPLSAIGLFSTGVNAANPGDADPNWTLAASPNGAATAFRTDIENGFPGGPWFANDSASRWLSPRPQYYSGDPNDPQGIFEYETTFDLTGYNKNTASIRFTWWNDNNGLDVILNGTSLKGSGALAIQGSVDGYSYVQQGFGSGDGKGTAFSTSLLNAGANTVRFVGYNQGGTNGNPTGTRVLFAGSVQAIPEPAFYQMSGLLLGGGLLALRLRRARRS